MKCKYIAVHYMSMKYWSIDLWLVVVVTQFIVLVCMFSQMSNSLNTIFCLCLSCLFPHLFAQCNISFPCFTYLDSSIHVYVYISVCMACLYNMVCTSIFFCGVLLGYISFSYVYFILECNFINTSQLQYIRSWNSMHDYARTNSLGFWIF